MKATAIQERRFVRYFFYVIVASFVADVVGCSAFQNVENWKEYPERDIRIETKSGTTYNLKRWKVAASGDITAEGEVHYLSPNDYFAARLFRPFRGIIPADSIAKVEVWRTDVVGTSVVVLLVTFVGFLSYGVITWAHMWG